MNDDPVLTQLDAEIKRLEVASREIDADLQKTREMRAWWVERHPVVVPLGQLGTVVEHDQALPVEVVKGGPTLKELIVKVLEDAAEPMPVPRIRDRALELGWQTESTHRGTMVRNYLGALQDEGVVEQLEDRRWRLVRHARHHSDNGEEPEVEATPTQPGPGG